MMTDGILLSLGGERLLPGGGMAGGKRPVIADEHPAPAQRVDDPYDTALRGMG
jgi:hypothetical protein